MTLHYLCFSCDLFGHVELMGPTPAGRDESDRPSYREPLRFTSYINRSWVNAKTSKVEAPSGTFKSNDGLHSGQTNISQDGNQTAP